MTFFDINVPMGQWIASQVVGMFAVICFFIAFQQKSKTRQLVVNAVANVFTIIASALLLNWIIVGTVAVMLANNIFFAFTSHNEKLPKWLPFFLLIFFCAISTIIVYFTWDGVWFNWLLLGTIFMFNYSKYAKGLHKLKIAGVIYFSARMVNAIMFVSITEVLKSIMIIISTLIFYIRWFNKRTSPTTPTPQGTYSETIANPDHIENNEHQNI